MFLRWAWGETYAQWCDSRPTSQLLTLTGSTNDTDEVVWGYGGTCP